MFLASFALFIWGFTSFQLFSWGLVFLILGICGFGILVGLFPNFRKDFWKFLGMLFLAWILAMGSCLFFRWRSSPQLLSDFWTFGWNVQHKEQKMSSLVGNYQVLEQTKEDRYVVEELKSGDNFTLKSKQSLELGSTYLMGVNQRLVDLNQTYGARFFIEGSGFREGIADFMSYEFSYEKWMLMKGYQGALYPKFIVHDAVGKGEKSLILEMRSWVRNQISKFFDKREGALLLGMLIGDKSQLDNTQYQQFVDSGIVHIIAVSGGNLVMIVIFLGAVLFFLPFYVRNAVIICGVVLFAMIAGGDSSVVRALIMSVLSLLALFWGREVQIWRLMKYAFVLMLCYNPYFLAYDLGFLLSFGALIGIVVCSEGYAMRSELVASKVQVKKKESLLNQMQSWVNQNVVKEYVLPTFGASLGTFPILLFFIGGTNLTGIVINLLIVPLVPVITIGGFIALLGSYFTGWSWLTLPVEWLLSLVFWLSKLAERFAVRIEVGTMPLRWGFLLILISILVVIFLIVQEERKRIDR